jgi:prophage DNA circulation protein
MNRTDKLLPASFKGIPFLVRNEVLSEGGRRIILHEYPNSSQRYVEDQGKLPPKFSVTAFVSGEDFLERAEQLERALQEKGKGRLVMPTFGAKKLFAMPYRKDASQREVGEIRFELEFVEGRTTSGPSKSLKNSQTVFTQGDNARSLLESSLDTAWIEPEDSSNVITAQFDLEQFVDSISILTTVVSNVADIDSTTNYIKSNLASLVRTGEDLAASFVGDLWQKVSVGLSGGQAIETLIELTKFGSELSLSLSDIKNASSLDLDDEDSDDIPLWDETTALRITRNQNRLSLINTGRVAALVTAYEQAADKTYDTDEEIDSIREALEKEHQRLMRVDTEDSTLIQSDPDIRRAVEDIRLSVLDVLDQKEQSVFKLTNITSNVPVGSFSLTYALYADDLTTDTGLTDKALEVRSLNPTQASDKLENDITVFQA